MPAFEPDYIEHAINSGFIQVMNQKGVSLPAYRAWPQLSGKFPGVAILHDWWGLTDPIRYLANRLAESGYNVIVPDLFDGQTASTPKEAVALLTALDEDATRRKVSAAVDVVEYHTHSNHHVAVFGVGMGGGLALATAQARDDIEAVVVYSAFPQDHLPTLDPDRTPIMAVYGAHDALVPPDARDAFRKLLERPADPNRHQFIILPGIGHDFFSPELTDEAHKAEIKALFHRTQAFLRRNLKRAQAPRKK